MRFKNELVFALALSWFFISTYPICSQIKIDTIYGITQVNDEYPSWSPDGSKIVFQSNRNDNNFEIYVMDADGKNVKRITFNSFEDETPVWSPDGKSILFSRYTGGDNNELFLIDADGSNERQLTNHPLRDGHAKFLADGSRIIFNSQRHDEGTLELKNYEIYEMNPDGSEIQRLTNHIEWDTYPSFSPDGQKVLWRRILTDTTAPRRYNSEIYTMNRDGSNIKNLSDHPSFDGYPVWSPDGKQILFVSSRHGQTTSHLQLFVMNSDGTNIRQLTRNNIEEEDVRPSWSSDGKKIVFNRDNPDGTRIHILELTSSGSGFYFNEVIHSSMSLPRNASRGVAWGDYNMDGFSDLLVANTMNNSNSLFTNGSNGYFAQKTEGPEVTSAGWTEGVSFVDFDNDNDLDIFFTTQFGARNELYRNDLEKGFVNIDAGDLTATSTSSTGSCWCDYDLDGDLDVYVVERDAGNDTLFENLGNGKFGEVSSTAFPYKGGDGRACVWGDTTGDGYPELYVGNFLDKTKATTTKAKNFYYQNMGNGTFIARDSTVITNEANLTYGASFVDFDQDNDLDLFITNIGKTDHNRLYANDGKGNFTETKTLISTAPSRPSKGHTWGDFDNDGDLDLFIANGTEGTTPEEIGNYLFKNDGQNNFELIENEEITASHTVSAGAAWSDYDRDGDLDIFLANWGGNMEANIFYRNDLYATNWLEISLRGTISNSYGIGTKVKIQATIEGKKSWLTRWLLPQTGYASQNEPIIHFGLGNSREVDMIEITWPSGIVQHLENVNVNQLLEITEPLR